MACPTCGGHILREGPATPVAIVCDPNNLLGGVGGGTSGLDYETLLLANPADLTQPVVVVNDFNPTTGVYTPVFRNIDGTVYAGATPVLPSGTSSVDFEIITGCDVVSQTAIWDAINLTTVGGVVSFDIDDGAGSAESISSVEFWNTTQSSYILDRQEDFTAPFSYSYDFTNTPDGLYRLHTTVTYPSGNSFTDIAVAVSVTAGIPTPVNQIPAGAHIGNAGTRTYNVSVEDVALYSDTSGTLLDIFALPLTATPVTYALLGTFELECPSPTVETVLGLDIVEQSAIVSQRLCYIDDTLNDGSALVEFTRLVFIESRSGTIIDGYNFNKELTGSYTVIGTATLCDETGTQATLVPRRRYLTAGSFTLPVTAQSISVQVKTVANTGTPPTINDGTSITPLFAGDSETWSAQDGSNIVLGGTLTISANAGDEIVIAWTEFV